MLLAHIQSQFANLSQSVQEQIRSISEGYFSNFENNLLTFCSWIFIQIWAAWFVRFISRKMALMYRFYLCLGVDEILFDRSSVIRQGNFTWRSVTSIKFRSVRFSLNFTCSIKVRSNDLFRRNYWQTNHRRESKQSETRRILKVLINARKKNQERFRCCYCCFLLK